MNLSKIKFLIPPLLIAAGIFFVSHQPYVVVPDIGIRIEDKILHFIAYLIFGLSIIYSICGLRKDINKKRLFLILLAIGSIYAISDEVHQFYVPGRNADVADFLADVLGIIGSYFVYPVIMKLVFKYKESKCLK